MHWVNVNDEFRVLKSRRPLPLVELARWPYPSLSLQLRQAESSGRGRQAGAATHQGRLRSARASRRWTRTRCRLLHVRTRTIHATAAAVFREDSMAAMFTGFRRTRRLATRLRFPTTGNITSTAFPTSPLRLACRFAAASGKLQHRVGIARRGGLRLVAPQIPGFQGGRRNHSLRRNCCCPPNAPSGWQDPADRLQSTAVRPHRWSATPGTARRLCSTKSWLQNGFADLHRRQSRHSEPRPRLSAASIRHQYGAIELKDQLTAVEPVAVAVSRNSTADRIGIWGWSNGGTMTLYALTHSDVFKAGVSRRAGDRSGATTTPSTPSATWVCPRTIPRATTGTSVPKAADNCMARCCWCMARSDDNVHFQNSVQMIDALIKADKPFRLMIYPNKTHGIAGKAARTHLFQMIEDHFERN